MSPLNTDRDSSNSSLAEKSDLPDNEHDVEQTVGTVSTEHVKDIYGLIDPCIPTICRNRLGNNENSTYLRQESNDETDTESNKSADSENLASTDNAADACDNRLGANGTNCDCGEHSSKDDKCSQCEIHKSRIYLKKKEDGLVRNASIRSALLKLSPTWVKTFINEPEVFSPVQVKRKNSELIHHESDSLFSTSSGFNNYRGLLNLCIILLVLSNARLFLENIIKYGILIDPLLLGRIVWNQPWSGANLVLVLASNVFILLIFYTEKALAKSLLSETAALVIQSVTLVLLLTIPAAVVLYLHPNPLISTTVLGTYTVLFLKLVSYASVNKWCRQARSPRRKPMKRSKSVCVTNGNPMEEEDENSVVLYPENLNYYDLYYFVMAPTLCYELNFPRSLRIRKRFLLKRFIEMLFIIQLIMGCIQQWILPLVHNSLKPLADMDGARVIERLLKLAVPNHFIWLMFFYWFFHSSLNVLAELLKFGDREFYKDWWNSETVMNFWTYWNIPVHRWASRHLYKPLMRRGWNKLHASVAVFFVSAFFHEYLLSVPLKMFRLWAFMGMLGQVPLALMQSKYMQGKYGNMVVWLSLIMGQPIAILAYFHDYYVMHIANETAAT